jgi:hypothetical protein
MEGSAEKRCKHGEVEAWCGESECMAARKNLPVRVWRTSRGDAYHRNPTCEALADGQQLAARYGKEPATPEQVPLSVAMSAGLAKCFHCFPADVPNDAKRCKVLVTGTWLDGFLLEWRRGPDNRWKGVVNYRHGAGRRVALKDQAQLMEEDRNTRPSS